jgi:hypothetical protein
VSGQVDGQGFIREATTSLCLGSWQCDALP